MEPMPFWNQILWGALIVIKILLVVWGLGALSDRLFFGSPKKKEPEAPAPPPPPPPPPPKQITKAEYEDLLRDENHSISDLLDEIRESGGMVTLDKNGQPQIAPPDPKRLKDRQAWFKKMAETTEIKPVVAPPAPTAVTVKGHFVPCGQCLRSWTGAGVSHRPSVINPHCPMCKGRGGFIMQDGRK
jgi:hypothetical protein